MSFGIIRDGWNGAKSCHFPNEPDKDKEPKDKNQKDHIAGPPPTLSGGHGFHSSECPT